MDLSLAPGEVDDLINLLSEWSGFRPAPEHPAALLEVRFQKKKPTKPNTETDAADEEGADEISIEIGILNSFYIDDIEAAIELVKTENTPTTLRQYLSPLLSDKRVDLY